MWTCVFCLVCKPMVTNGKYVLWCNQRTSVLFGRAEGRIISLDEPFAACATHPVATQSLDRIYEDIFAFHTEIFIVYCFDKLRSRARRYGSSSRWKRCSGQ